jgi:hypothetical protein
MSIAKEHVEVSAVLWGRLNKVCEWIFGIDGGPAIVAINVKKARRGAWPANDR